MQGNPSYRLIMRRGPQPNQVYELTDEVSNVGRDITNEIVINDREVSRHHLRFMRGGDGYTVEDLGSTNGTFINGKRLTGAQPLKNGDMIGLGETVTLQYEAVRPGGSNAQETMPSAQQQDAPASQPAAIDDRFKPPQRSPQPRQQDNPYQEQPAYQQAQQDPYESQDYEQSQSYGQSQQDAYYAPAAAYGPPPPGYDYDPYAVREEEGSTTTQWLLIGCLGLLLLCCCMSVVIAVAIDTFCLYENVPFVINILEAIGFAPQC